MRVYGLARHSGRKPDEAELVMGVKNSLDYALRSVTTGMFRWLESV